MVMPLRGHSFELTGEQPSLRFAAELLRLLGAVVVERGGLQPSLAMAGAPVRIEAEPDLAPSAAWAASGAMALTGDPDGPPRPGPPELPARMKAAALVARLLAACHPHLGDLLDLDGPRLLGERAALANLQREG